MDKQGLLNREGLWNRRGALLGGSILGAAFIGFHYLFVGQLLGALAIFTVAWLALLLAAFSLALVAWVGTSGLIRLAARVVALPLVASSPIMLPAWLNARRQLRKSPGPWRWRKLEWAEARAFSLPAEWRRSFLRPTDSRAPQKRRAA